MPSKFVNSQGEFLVKYSIVILQASTFNLTQTQPITTNHNMTTQTKFISGCSLPPKLVSAVVCQAGGWSNFKNLAKQVTDHGADAGWPGFTFHSDTIKFAKRHMRWILEIVKSQAAEQGICFLEMIQSFRCIKGSTVEEIGETIWGNSNQLDTTVANGLAWYSLEEVCQAYASFLDSQLLIESGN